MVRLNLEGIYQISDDLNKKVIHNFITNITVVNSSDLLLAFSFYSKEKLIISLNHQSPFLGFVYKDYSPHTVLGQLNDNLRKYVKGAYIEKVEVINNDRILKFTLYKSNEFYEKESYSLILELIPTINNLILLNDKSEIVFAKHYSDLSAARPIIKGLKYQAIEKNKTLSRGEFDLEKYQKEVDNYVLESDNKKQKEKVLPLYNALKQKEKSLKKKIKVLNEEKEEAEKNLVYQEYGQYLLTYIYNKEDLDNYIESIKDKYDEKLSPEKNAEKFFDKYKKCKRTISNDIREIEKAENDLKEVSHYLSTFEYLASEEIATLEEKYLPHHKQVKRKEVIDASMPYYVTYQNVKIGFGKNKDQNNFLTFKKANKEDTFIHASQVHASHVVVFDSNPNNEVLLVASEIALLLAGKNDGEVQVAKVKDIKKGPEKGLVILNKYESYNLREIRNETKLLIKSQKRF